MSQLLELGDEPAGRKGRGWRRGEEERGGRGKSDGQEGIGEVRKQMRWKGIPDEEEAAEGWRV